MISADRMHHPLANARPERVQVGCIAQRRLAYVFPPRPPPGSGRESGTDTTVWSRHTPVGPALARRCRLRAPDSRTGGRRTPGLQSLRRWQRLAEWPRPLPRSGGSQRNSGVTCSRGDQLCCRVLQESQVLTVKHADQPACACTPDRFHKAGCLLIEFRSREEDLDAATTGAQQLGNLVQHLGSGGTNHWMQENVCGSSLSREGSLALEPRQQVFVRTEKGHVAN